MKMLDGLIVLLVFLVLGSGGFLGYLVYTNLLVDKVEVNNDVNTDVNTDVIDSEAQPEIICEDLDGDGYGEGCAVGLDCDDNDRNRNEQCEVMEGQISLVPTTDSEIYAIDDIVEFDIVLDGVPVMGQSEEAETLQLRIDFDPTILQYNEFKINSDAGFSLPIELETKDRYEVEMAVYEGISDGSKIGTLSFNAISSGSTEVTVAEDSRVFIIYEIDGGTASVIVE